MSNDTAKTIEIPLTRGYMTTVDECDSDLVSYRWHALIWKHLIYAKTTNKELAYPLTSICIHRVILSRIIGRPLARNEYCDHVNGNPLDNRRCNLRIATPTQNSHNRRLKSNSSSGFKGVSWHKHNKQWQAYIRINKKLIHLGFYETREEAHAAYVEVSRKNRGEFHNPG
jgi:hypothetical protein